MKEPFRLKYKDAVIAWYRFGSGSKHVFCFHGYGENARTFSFLEKIAGTAFSFFAIDLPFHGHTIWNEKDFFTHTDLLAIINEIDRNNNEKIMLMGFSLGGRVALSYFQSMPEKIEKLILLAPDGLKVNGWYWLATQTWPGNKLFLFTMHYPGWFFGLLRLMNKLRLVNSSVYKFVNHYIEDRSLRILLYNRWNVLKKLRPDLSKIKSLINKNSVRTRLLYGRHDKIILSSVGEKFRAAIEEHCTLTIIASGHQVLHEKHLNEILPALLD